MTPPKSHVVLLSWYIAFGALHELSHILAASLVNATGGLLDEGFCALAYRVLLGRCVVLPDLVNSDYEWLVRHAGWLSSFVLALAVRKFYSHGPPTSGAAATVATITALEAIWTDLLQQTTLSGLNPLSASLFCGNFGIILLHHAWFSNGGDSALDVLEKMVKVTMMRGAQSGGVVSFHPQSKQPKQSQPPQLRGVRSRVVNKKRTDLSLLVRSQVHQDNFLFKKKFPRNFVPTFSGHTRFATSSKASLKGTHPQQWCPASSRRVYNLHVPHIGPHRFQVTADGSILVENYITHNGDFDFYVLNGKTYDLEVIQKWLVLVTKCPMPATVDSCAVAGIVDLLRTQGCFGLSARYAVCLGMSTSEIRDDIHDFPTYSHFESIGRVFEEVLSEMLKATTFEAIADSEETRGSFALRVVSKLEARQTQFITAPLQRYIRDDEEGDASLYGFCMATINAFFDNDLFMTTKTFLKNAKGSFGLCVTSSLDAHRQICLAARGQTMSIAFYPSKGLICYGSEQAAVKAGLSVGFPGEKDSLGRSRGDIDNDALRLDLDDLGGEVILLDWGNRDFRNSPVSKPNRHLKRHETMNGIVHAILFQESKATTQDPQIYHRMTRLTRNPFVKPLQEESKDLILKDIQDIPKLCQAIQDDWDSKKAATSLNRLTAYTLSRCLRKRLEDHIAGTVSHRAVDILLTGCEVSLWLAEQFASDLQKALPRLRVMAVSSNKLLGLYGQEIAVPSLGFPYSSKTYDLHDTIVIIVSHSGGTFAPLSCSNLLQSTTRNIFVVTSEWDTQIGKQLRAMDALENVQGIDDVFRSRIFTTEVGMRPAEPCSISVAATHQLLTNLFEYICVLVLDDRNYRRITGATISEEDLRILETCNRENVCALSEIVGSTRYGYGIDRTDNLVESELRKAGDVWSEHVLENVKAYIMTFVYIFATVISGYPLAYAIAYGAGLEKSNPWIYLIHAIDAAIYFWLPQINITLLRFVQGRNLRHRMVGRTVVIGDIPWVAQSAEAFLSKIFACSYSIAGINVLSGNPADHLVHRHTHRVVRGTLLVCGRPDGRLSALSTAESAVCLSVNQASSIQSLGGTCESITIGHNPFQLPLSTEGIFLKRKRPLFLCERMLVEADSAAELKKDSEHNAQPAPSFSLMKFLNLLQPSTAWDRKKRNVDVLDLSSSRHRDSSIRLRGKMRSAPALLGAYMNLDESSDTEDDDDDDDELSVSEIVESTIRDRKWSDQARKLFQAFDLDGDGFIAEDEYVKGLNRLQSRLDEEEARQVFKLADTTKIGHIDYDEFLHVLHISDIEKGISLPPSHRDQRGHIQIEPSSEKYFGETLRKYNAGKAGKHSDFMVARSQETAMQLYETRVASLQRFVAMTVMFHQMGMRVQTFFEKMSFGLLGYRMDRTHSIMRIATTASPVSGAEVKQQMRQLQLRKKVKHSIHVISVAYLNYKTKKEKQRVLAMERKISSVGSLNNLDVDDPPRTDPNVFDAGGIVSKPEQLLGSSSSLVYL